MLRVGEGGAPTKRPLASDAAPHAQAAGFVALIFGTFALIGALYWWFPDDLIQDRVWASRPWVEMPCLVESTGIAYRGNCELNTTLRMTTYELFQECLGPNETSTHRLAIERQWEETPPGLCAARGDLAYEEAREGSIRRRLWGHVEIPFRVECHNAYLLWAAVRVMNGSDISSSEQHCAYEYGASNPSISGEWEDIVDKRKHLQLKAVQNEAMPCWVLASEAQVADACVIAFSNIRKVIELAREEESLMKKTGIACTVLTLLASAYACCFHFRSEEKSSYRALPKSDPDDDTYAHAQVIHLAAAAYGEVTPPASGGSTLRAEEGGGHRGTIEVLAPNGLCTTVPRNVAADFLTVKSSSELSES